MILQRMDSAFQARNYSLAVSIGEKYATVADSQLTQRLSDARAEQKRVTDRAKEQELLAQLQRTPANDLAANRDLYQQLVALNPTNATYKAKYEDLDNRINQRHSRVHLMGHTARSGTICSR